MLNQLEVQILRNHIHIKLKYIFLFLKNNFNFILKILNLKKGGKCHFRKDKIGSTCSGYIDIAKGDEDALKEAVATQGAVSVAIDVTEDKFMFYNGQNY